MQFLFPCHFSHLERDFSSFIMKPIDEKIETSRTNHNAGDHENLPWSLSITNIPYSVFDDENTKVRIGCRFISGLFEFICFYS